MMASCLNDLKVQDIIDLNKIINETKKYPDMSVKIQSIPEKDMCFGVITDASYGNTETYSSQGGYGILCYHKELEKNGIGRGNLIYWRSGKIHRVVNSPLAAETQRVSKS